VSKIAGTSAECKDDEPEMIAGVVAAPSSVTSIQVANLLKLFRIPQVMTVAPRSAITVNPAYGNCMQMSISAAISLCLDRCVACDDVAAVLLQVSFFSTSPALSSNERYPFFARTIPSDLYQAEAMVRLVRLFNWTYVSVVYEESSYGQEVSPALMRPVRKQC
jgi:metabotropic X receptor